MNDKEKQIEELANIIKNTWLVDLEGDTMGVCEVLDEVDIKGIASELVEQGYRKIPEGTVVMSKEEIEIRQENYLNGIKYWQDMANKARKQASIEFSERVKSKIIELRRKYHEDCINGIGDEEYNGLSGNNVDELLKEMGVE